MKDILNQVFDPEEFRTLGHQLIDLLANHHEANLNRSNPQAIPWKEPNQNLETWNTITDAPASAEQLFKTILENSTAVHHPKYIGHQVGMASPVSVLFGLLSSYLNNGMAVYEMGLVSSVLEKWVIDNLCEKFGYGKESGGVLTSGGTLANLTALLTARRVKYDNLENPSMKPALMVSEQAHYCVDRAALTMGWDKEAVIKIPVDEQFSMRTDLLDKYLAKAKENGYQVIAIVGSACSTSTGSYDNLNAIADFAEEHQLWFHVDGAHGACVIFSEPVRRPDGSESYKSKIKGIERADSLILDFHKMLMTPALATALLYKNNQDSFQTFQTEAVYLLDTEQDWHNTGKRTYECTKYMMSVKVYSIWKLYGEEAFAKYVDRCYDLAREFANMILTKPNFELGAEVQSNIICFRWFDDSLSMEVLNRLNLNIRQQLLEDGEYYIVQTRLNGKVYLRMTVMNVYTNSEDVNSLLGKINGLVHQLT